MEEIMSNAKAFELTGEETQVHFSSAFPYFWLRNDGGSTVLMSLFSDIEEGKDGVIEVPAGSSAGTMHGYNATCNDLYISGSGKVQVMGTYTPENPFKTARKGGENNGKILLNIPLASNINDISEFNHTTTYTGSTPLTITQENGIYLYKGQLRVADVGFLADIPKFKIEFDVKFNNTGVDNSLSYARRLLALYGSINDISYGVGCNGVYNSSRGNCVLNLQNLDNSQKRKPSEETFANYGDAVFHHIILIYDSVSTIIQVTVDNGDPIIIWLDHCAADNLYWGRTDQYGLNGYVKNIIIKELE